MILAVRRDMVDTPITRMTSNGSSTTTAVTMATPCSEVPHDRQTSNHMSQATSVAVTASAISAS